jgi:hypothetical protein
MYTYNVYPFFSQEPCTGTFCANKSRVTHFSCLIQHWLLFKAMIYVIGWNMLTIFRHFPHKNHLHVAFVEKKTRRTHFFSQIKHIIYVIG